MTQIPAGWYPDPAPQTAPGRLRYWDGAGWTEHLHDPQPPAYPAAHPQVAPQPYGQLYGQAYGQPTARPVPTTPDGQRLSGWWRRVLATLLDGLFQGFLVAIALIPVLVAERHRVHDWFQQAADSNRFETPQLALFGTAGWQVAVLAILVVVPTIYTLAFWRWKQATPGKLIVGVRIRRRDRPGPMPWSTMIIRFGFVEVLSLAGRVPWVGLLFALAGLLDYLWPLWDDKNQALHEKVAGTNVVLVDPPATTTEQRLIEAGLPPRW